MAGAEEVRRATPGTDESFVCSCALGDRPPERERRVLRGLPAGTCREPTGLSSKLDQLVKPPPIDIGQTAIGDHRAMVWLRPGWRWIRPRLSKDAIAALTSAGDRPVAFASSVADSVIGWRPARTYPR
jgi:hypothetical protein